MIFIKTNNVDDVIFCHTDPFHETYGLGKTAEELRAEGFLVDYLKELPTAEKRKGYRGITCFADNRFWFRYVVQELTVEEQYIEQMSVIQEKQSSQEKIIKAQKEENELLKEQVEQLGFNVDTSITYAGDAHNKADQTLQETAMMTMELMFKEEAIQSQEAELIRQKALMAEQKKLLDAQQTLVTTMTTDLVAEKAKILAQKQEIEMTIQETAMMTMELMNLSEALEVTKEEILAANEVAKEMNQKILQANEEMVTTKAELLSAQENLMLTQSEVANMLLMMLDERGTVE